MWTRIGKSLRNAGADLKRYEFFGVEWDDLDVLVIYFAVFFHILLLEILNYEVSVVIFQIMENYGKEKLIAAAMCRCRDVSGYISAGDYNYYSRGKEIGP